MGESHIAYTQLVKFIQGFQVILDRVSALDGRDRCKSALGDDALYVLDGVGEFDLILVSVYRFLERRDHIESALS
jgi:hypothetical protein